MKNNISYNIDKIADNLYLSGIEGVSEVDYLLKENISQIISILDSDIPKVPDGIKQIIIKVDDYPSTNLIKFFKECIDNIEKDTKTLVHCRAGASRSATIVIAYIMWKTKVSYYKAYFTVKNKRPFIDPNDGFVKQMKMFESLLLLNQYDLDKIDFEHIIWENK